MSVNEASLERRLAAATLERAQAYWDLGNRELALKDFQEAHDYSADLTVIPYSKVIYQIGMEKQESGDLEEALQDLQFAAGLAPESEWKSEIQQRIKDIENEILIGETSTILRTECPNCGRSIQAKWKICAFCGKSLNTQAT